MYGMLVDADFVYVTSWCSDASLARLPASGGAATTLLPGVGAPPSALQCGSGVAVDGAAIYVGRVAYDEVSGANTATISRIDKVGGASHVLASQIDGRPAIVSDEQFLYYTLGWSSAASGVYRLSKSGGPPDTLARGDFAGIAVDATYVYAGNDTTGQILRTTKDGAQQLAMGGTFSSVDDLALDADALYWTDARARRVYSMPIGGGIPKAIASDLPYTPSYLAVDATRVYLTTTDGNLVAAMDKDGSNFTVLASVQFGGSYALAVDDRFVYWTAFVNGDLAGSVWRLAK